MDARWALPSLQRPGSQVGLRGEGVHPRAHGHLHHGRPLRVRGSCGADNTCHPRDVGALRTTQAHTQLTKRSMAPRVAKI
jgi:hypothetical protein